MYIREEITLNDLEKQKSEHGQPSVKALRARAEEGILVYTGMSGASKLYDKQLSIIRCRGAHLARQRLSSPRRVPWNTMAQVISQLDRGMLRPWGAPDIVALNDWLIAELPSNSDDSVAEKFCGLLCSVIRS